jgi:hypothetical protein
VRLEPNRARTIRVCKLKRVYPRLPFRVHSAVAKGLTENGLGDRSAAKHLPQMPSAHGNRAPIGFGSASKTR